MNKTEKDGFKAHVSEMYIVPRHPWRGCLWIQKSMDNEILGSWHVNTPDVGSADHSVF